MTYNSFQLPQELLERLSSPHVKYNPDSYGFHKSDVRARNHKTRIAISTHSIQNRFFLVPSLHRFCFSFVLVYFFLIVQIHETSFISLSNQKNHLTTYYRNYILLFEMLCFSGIIISAMINSSERENSMKHFYNFFLTIYHSISQTCFKR